MYGAILGDIISQQRKQENDGIFYLVDRKFKFTDYTVMTIAIADALLPINDDEEFYESQIKTNVMKSLAVWGKKYQDAEYSRHFKTWLSKLFPLKDSDNSAAAAISVIPYMYNDSNQVVETAKMVAAVTHSDIQSINNAGIAALAIYYAKMCPRVVFKNNLESAFACDFDDPDDLTNIVFEAIRDFLDSTNLENAIENAIARGGDMRTRAVIAGSIAEAFYGIPSADKSMCNRELTEEMFAVLDKFDQAARRVFLKAVVDESDLFGNKRIEMAAERFNSEQTEENFDRVMESIYYRMYEDAELYVPLVLKDRKDANAKHSMESDDYEYLRLKAPNGKYFIAAFTTTTDELDEEYPDMFLTSIKDFFEEFLQEDREEIGIILNPSDGKKYCALTKPLIEVLLQKEAPKNQMFYYGDDINELPVLDAIVTSEEATLEDALFEDDDKLAAAHFMTKSPNNELQYIIHTPLLNYHGTDEKVVSNCYWYCLEIARKYHLHSVAFPAEFFKTDYVQASDGRQVLGVALSVTSDTWFNRKSDYGMTVIAAINEKKEVEPPVDESIGNEQIEKAIEIYHKESSEENKFNVLKAIQGKMYEAGKFLTLMEPETEYPCHDLEYDLFEENGKTFIVAFTSSDESFDKENNKESFTCKTKIEEIVKLVADEIFDGIIINRYGKKFIITPTLAKKIIRLPKIEPLEGSGSERKEHLEFDKQKSGAYKKLVQDMQEKYPKYELDFSKGAAISTSEGAKQKAREFAQKFNSKADFWKALKDLGFKWKAENSSDANIKNMWAINALAVAIDRGFNPNDEVYLWAPYVKINDKLSCICNEINLWTYWQGLGYAEKTPKIKYLLVGHDWDNPFVDNITKPNQKLSAEKLIERIKKINNGDIDVPYLDFNYYVYPTDKNLIELFKKLGYDNVRKNDISKQRHDELFFTNFCLGYLTKGKVDINLMMKDEDLFKELVHILEPENILCLSQDTFICVYKALTGDEATNFDSRVKGKYNDFLDDHADIIISCGDVDIRIYPLAHCGGMGTAMRSLNLQMKDWEKIAEDNK